MKDLYVVKGGKKLRCGYTTGSCSAAAAKACVMMLLENKKVWMVSIDTPAGVNLELEVKSPELGPGYSSCCIIKDGGDDPDATNGMEICARVSRRMDDKIVIDGGEGIGRITRKGLLCDVGEAAINPMPRKMIEKEIRKISPDGYDVLIYAPRGAKIGEKTFNPNLGIKGGISILGTSGIVEPMSEKALLETIYLEIDLSYDEGYREIILFPGNYGENMAQRLDLQGKGVQVSNYIGESIAYAYNKGFKKITLVGHIGKLSKVSLGAFNTHSRVCDIRMEALVYYLAFSQAPLEILNQVKACTTTEEALEIIIKTEYKSILQDMKKGCIERIRKYLKDDNFDIDIYIYSMKYGVL
jgi:cobalt-precorrin-5B (C1)-methyltransferase